VEAQRELATEIERFEHIARETKNRKTEAEAHLRAAEKTKVVSQAKLEKLQAKQRLFGSQKTILKSPEAFDSTFANLKNQEQQVIGLIDMLVADFPYLTDNLLLIKERVFG
jgi:hypothetical protein